MYYSFFAWSLFKGFTQTGKEIWPLISWCHPDSFHSSMLTLFLKIIDCDDRVGYLNY